MNSENTEKNKRAALDFLQLVVSGKIDEAYAKHVDMGGKHHNVWTGAGFPALMQGMKENHVKFPQKKFEVKHALADGDMVATHSHIVLDQKEEGIAVVHLFRFNGGRIVEFWDVGLKLEKDAPNKDGAF